MRIYYDGIIYGLYRDRPGGISNFFDHLISRVSQHHKCLLTSARPANLPHPIGPKLRIARHNFEIRPAHINQKIRQQSFAIRASLFFPDLVHATYYGRPSIYTGDTPLIYTAYDMIHEKFRHQMDPFGAEKAKKLSSFERASFIPCISESTRHDLLSLYPHLEPKTSVIYLAGGLKTITGGSPVTEINKQRTDNKFLLYVGARSVYKNFTRLILAFSQISSSLPWLRLKVVGSQLNNYEIDLLDAVGVVHKVDLYPDLPDKDLYKLYQNSLAFVYPSLCEGFGLPLLEAMALNTPVLAANTSSIPEVVGEAALLFNPWSVDSIKDAILKIIQRPELRNDMIIRGRERLQKFSWEKTTAAYLELYDRAVRLHK